MKKLLYITSLVMMLAMVSIMDSCSGKNNPTANEADSALSREDSLDLFYSQHPMPKAADNLFCDFLFNFMTRRDVQFERTIFPLKEVTGTMAKHHEKKDWKMDGFFSNQYFYTIILDNEKQIELKDDTTITHAVVEKIYLEKKTIKQFVFDRIKGAWMLTQIVNTPMEASPNNSFLDFYNGFVTDSVFQSKSLADNLMFSGPDPDDDLSNIEGVLLPEQFPSFAPPMPRGLIYNIIFGEEGKDSDTKILLIEGISNGNESVMVFKRRGGKWKLYNLTM